jgi:hypothetical protein
MPDQIVLVEIWSWDGVEHKKFASVKKRIINIILMV